MQQCEDERVEPKLLWWVGAGGALGSVARYMLTYAIQWQRPTAFPYATLAINTSGSLLLGFLLSYWIASTTLSAELRLFLTVGFCGGFTTFSAFAYETADLIESANYRAATAYVIMSVVLSIAATFTGFALARALLSSK